jgi:hypothetical protein
MSTIARSGWLLANEPDQLGSVTGLADHVVPSLLEEAHQALAQQDLVVSDDHARATRLLGLGHLGQYGAGRVLRSMRQPEPAPLRAMASV